MKKTNLENKISNIIRISPSNTCITTLIDKNHIVISNKISIIEINKFLAECFQDENMLDQLTKEKTLILPVLDIHKILNDLNLTNNYEEFLDIINDNSIPIAKTDLLKLKKEFEFSKKIILAKLKTKGKNYLKIYHNIDLVAKTQYRETGLYPMYIATTFIRGILENFSTNEILESAINSPLIFFPVTLSIEKNFIKITLTETTYILNQKLLLYLERSLGVDLNINLKDIKFEELIKIFQIKFSIDYSENKNIIKSRTEFTKYCQGSEKKAWINDEFILGLFDPTNCLLFEDTKKIVEEENDVFDTNIKYSKDQIFDLEVKNKNKIIQITKNPLNIYQRLAITSALEQNTIVYGPPGTGKSETIANFLATILFLNKTGLVSSEKITAINILKERLGELQNFCLFADSQITKKEFYNKILKIDEYLKINEWKSWELWKSNEKEIDSDFFNLLNFKEELKEKSLAKTLEFLQFYSNETTKKNLEKYLEEIKEIDENKIKKFEDIILYLNERNLTIEYWYFILYIKNLNNLTSFTLEEKIKEFIKIYADYKKWNVSNLSDFVKNNDLEKVKNLNISDPIIKLFLTNDFDKILIIWNDFNNLITKLNLNIKNFINKDNVKKYLKHWDNKKEIDALLKKNNFKLKLFKSFSKHLTTDGILFKELLDILAKDKNEIFFSLESFVLFEKNIKSFENKNILFFIQHPNYEDFKFENFRFENELVNFKIEEDFFNYIKMNSEFTFNSLQLLINITTFKTEYIKMHKDSLELNFNELLKNYKESINYDYLITNHSLVIIIVANLQRRCMQPENHQAFKQVIEMVRIANLKRQKNISVFIKQFKDGLNLLFNIWLGRPEQLINYVKTEKNSFDYGIFDEASQIFMENSISLLYRCQNNLVAGDDKQLAPSSFFTSRNSNEIEDEEIDLECATSLLDRVKAQNWTSYNLKNHYRSNSYHLIDFSNQFIYNNTLEIASINFLDKSIIPLEVIDIIDGEFNNGINEKEAQFAINLISKNHKLFKKVIVITFNRSQADYITDLLFQTDEIDLIEKLKDGDLIIKNLENIQGNEADLVILVNTYAPKNGKLNNNFGQLIKINGRNSLNVALTRAREKMIVIKSFKATEMKVSVNNEDAIIYYEFINYLDHLKIEENLILEEQIINKLQKDIKETLIIEDDFKNYKIISNLKVGTKIIDIVFLNEENNVLLGIEIEPINQKENFKEKIENFERQFFLNSRGYPIYRISEYNWNIMKKSIIKEISIEIQSIINSRINKKGY